MAEWLEYWAKQWEYFGEVFKKPFSDFLSKVPQQLKVHLERGFLRYYNKYNVYYTDTPALADLIISAIYRDLQYGYPECEPCPSALWKKDQRCIQSMKNKLAYIYLTMATLDELLKDKGETIANMIRGFGKLANKYGTNVVDALSEDMWDSIKDKIDVKLKEVKNIIRDVMNGKIKRMKFARKETACLNYKTKKSKIECLIGSIFGYGLNYLEGFVGELAALYVYIANNKMILPFGVMQHVIYGPLTLAQDLGDFLDPETDSLINVKRFIRIKKARRYLAKLSANLRKPIYIVVPRYYRAKDGSINHDCIVLDKYELRYICKPNKGLIEYVIPTWGFLGAKIPGELLKVKPRIDMLSERPVIDENPETGEKFEGDKCKCIDAWNLTA